MTDRTPIPKLAGQTIIDGDRHRPNRDDLFPAACRSLAWALTKPFHQAADAMLQWAVALTATQKDHS